MSGRRSYHRYSVTNAEGNLKVVRDVTVRRGASSEFVVISDEPAAAGELLMLERQVGDEVIVLEVCVVDSRPAIVNGSVRHRLRLRPSHLPDGRDARPARRVH